MKTLDEKLRERDSVMELGVAEIIRKSIELRDGQNPEVGSGSTVRLLCACCVCGYLIDFKIKFLSHGISSVFFPFFSFSPLISHPFSPLSSPSQPFLLIPSLLTPSLPFTYGQVIIRKIADSYTGYAQMSHIVSEWLTLATLLESSGTQQNPAAVTGT